jgi:membrane-bound lytic murein transglycosylase B
MVERSALLAACALATTLVLAARAQPRSFDEWLQGVRRDALSAGISVATLDTALTGLQPLETVIERDRTQPEFTLDFRSYLARVASESRIEEGQRMMGEHAERLRAVGERYGMPPALLAAVWGVESNFGRTQGDFSVIQALATLAHDGRRSALFRRQLLDALRILDQGHIEIENMKGSWAGAMGQMQFMPSTFIAYARDGDGDGRKDIWGSAADALESAASFMSSSWQPGLWWGRQVIVPPTFNSRLASLQTTRTLAQWRVLGVRLPGGEALPRDTVRASIIFPDAAAREPAFLVFQNYRALLRWNQSQFFALAVGHLADRIAGGPPLHGF